MLRIKDIQTKHFLEKSYTKCGEVTSPDPFLKN